MKRFALVLAGVVILVAAAACIYEAPLSEKQGIAVDQSALGLWELVPEPGETDKRVERMAVLKFSETEYVIDYFNGQNAMYFRGYPIKVAGVSCVQVQLIGTNKGPVEEKKRDFHVIKYEAKEKELLVALLNDEVVKNEIEDAAGLKEAFARHKRDPNLWKKMNRFKRVK